MVVYYTNESVSTWLQTQETNLSFPGKASVVCEKPIYFAPTIEKLQSELVLLDSVIATMAPRHTAY